MRIVSLLPSATEIVCRLGFEDALVGCSHECDYPPSVQSLPHCTAPKFQPDGSSQEIHDRVTQLQSDANAVYRIETERLQALKPDVIVTQAQCDVCAVSLDDVERAAQELFDQPPTIISLQPTGLNDVFDDILHVAKALGAADQGEQVCQELRARVHDITHRARNLDPKPRVVCLEWLSPLMAAGNWAPELVERAGGQECAGQARRHSTWMEWDQLREIDPEYLILMPCGFSMQQTEADLPALQSHEDWPKLRAVREGKVFITDGNQYFNRPGPRLVESLEILAEIMHPGQFSFGHEGSGWRRINPTTASISKP